MTESERYQLFKDCCQYWIDKLSMHDIEFIYLFVDDSDEDEIASTQYRYDSHQALMMIASDVDDPDMIRSAARHEVLEVFLMPLKLQSINTGDAYHPYTQRETHSVIHILERLL